MVDRGQQPVDCPRLGGLQAAPRRVDRRTDHGRNVRTTPRPRSPGGSSPDAYFGSFQNVQAGAYKKLFAPLDRYIGRDKVDINQYYVGSRAGAVFRGQVYALPHHSNVRSLYVNDRALPGSRPRPLQGARILGASTANQRLRSVGPGGAGPGGVEPHVAVRWPHGGDVLPGQRRTPLHRGRRPSPVLPPLPAGERSSGCGEFRGRPWGAGGHHGVPAASSAGARAKPWAGARPGSRWPGSGSSPATRWGSTPDLCLGQWPIPGGPSARGKTFGYVAATSGVVPNRAPARPDAGWEWTKYQASVEGQRLIPRAPAAPGTRPASPGVANDPRVAASRSPGAGGPTSCSARPAPRPTSRTPGRWRSRPP